MSQFSFLILSVVSVRNLVFYFPTSDIAQKFLLTIVRNHTPSDLRLYRLLPTPHDFFYHQTTDISVCLPPSFSWKKPLAGVAAAPRPRRTRKRAHATGTPLTRSKGKGEKVTGEVAKGTKSKGRRLAARRLRDTGKWRPRLLRKTLCDKNLRRLLAEKQIVRYLTILSQEVKNYRE